jgi:hypothetical protein
MYIYGWGLKVAIFSRKSLLAYEPSTMTIDNDFLFFFGGGGSSKIKQFYILTDPGSGALPRDPGWAKSKDPGSGINNPDRIS